MIIDCNNIEGKIMMCVYGEGTYEKREALKDYGMEWNASNWHAETGENTICDGMGFWSIEIPKAQTAPATLAAAAEMIKAVFSACGYTMPDKAVAISGKKFDTVIKAAF